MMRKRAKGWMLLGAVTAGAVSAGSACSASNAPSAVAATGSGGVGGAGGGEGTGGFLGAGGSTEWSGPQTCADALANKSYIGCEYWPTISPNSRVLSVFHFAVSVANSTSQTAVVDVDRAGKSVAHVMVAPGQLGVVNLPWVNELKQQFGETGEKVQSALVKGGAYHLTSSVPVTVVQWNPIDFEHASVTSHSNDASILLPTPALGGDYYGLSWPTVHWDSGPGSDGAGGGSAADVWSNHSGFLVVTATEDGTKVSVASTAYVRAGAGVAATAPGANQTFDLDKGDVLALVADAPPPGPTSVLGKPCLGGACIAGPEYDLTGSHITSTKPVAVLGGHDDAMIPYYDEDEEDANHMEETMFPIETLGRGVVVTAPRATDDVPYPTFVRILSASDGNMITLDPPLAPAFTLDAGQWKELGPLTVPFAVTGTKRVAIAQYTVGSEAFTNSIPDRGGAPSQSTSVPTEQYSSEYTFLASPTFTVNYVDVIAPHGATITLDGVKLPASGFKPVGQTSFDVAFHALKGGSHKIAGDQKFGIVTYGYADDSSYMMPGGMDLTKLVIPE